MQTSERIRRARPDEASQLSDLAFRSKASWGYDSKFMESCRQELTVSEAAIRNRHIFVLEDLRGLLLGFYTLKPLKNNSGVADLFDFFIEPGCRGQGYGRALWQHATSSAAKLGYERIYIEADPYAESFYANMGATRVGDVESRSIPGRMLPLMSFDLRSGNGEARSDR